MDLNQLEPSVLLKCISSSPSYSAADAELHPSKITINGTQWMQFYQDPLVLPRKIQFLAEHDLQLIG